MKRRRHPPDIREPFDYDCMHCGQDVLAPIHRPPSGWRESILDVLGLLREP